MTEKRALSRELLGERVIVRCWRPDDAAMHHEALGTHREALLQWLSWPNDFLTLAQSQDFVQRMHTAWEAAEKFIFVITRRDDGRMLGGSGLNQVDWRTPSAETGYFLLPDAEGKGYMGEAFSLIIKAAFDELGLARLWSTCDATNTRSWQLLERSGFSREGLLRNERRNHQGQLRDTYLYAMTDSEYSQRKTP